MTFNIKYQQEYSRTLLLLRTFFGWFYIGIPHAIAFLVYQIYFNIMIIFAWFGILFAGKYPRFAFDGVVSFAKYYYRLLASLYNLTDVYPSLSLENQENDILDLKIEYPESVSRTQLLLTTFFGPIYVLLVHGFFLFFRYIVASFLGIAAWFVVLFTGKYPQEWHKFWVATLRWEIRAFAYFFCLSPKYPPFNGQE